MDDKIIFAVIICSVFCFGVFTGAFIFVKGTTELINSIQVENIELNLNETKLVNLVYERMVSDGLINQTEETIKKGKEEEQNGK